MRPTNVAQSGMPTGKAYMGWWGDMGGPKQKGTIQYSLSPFKQRAFAGALHGYLFNGYTRLAAQAPYFAIPIGTAYAVYLWANKKDAYLNSKAGHGHSDH
ncbi:ubiquinol--cytochrome-c reductase subunit 8 [Ceratobasidium sp. 394]|nr:ubiquinol--cytochrome-c reductase subunit 8 [Ceratobasidium sp. 394]